jgi:hypothetical protein
MKLYNSTIALPCPFCRHDQDQNEIQYYFGGEGPPPMYAVECCWCGALGSPVTGKSRGDHEGAKQNALKVWNEAPRRSEKSVSLADACQEAWKWAEAGQYKTGSNYWMAMFVDKLRELGVQDGE